MTWWTQYTSDFASIVEVDEPVTGAGTAVMVRGQRLTADIVRSASTNSADLSGRAVAAMAICHGLDQPGWDGGDAQPVTAEVVEEATRLVSQLLSQWMPLPDIAPSPDGSIGMEWWNANARVFVDVCPEGLTRIYYNPGIGNHYEEETTSWGQGQLTTRIVTQLTRLSNASSTETERLIEIAGFDLSPVKLTSGGYKESHGSTIASSRSSRLDRMELSTEESFPAVFDQRLAAHPKFDRTEKIMLQLA